MEGDSKPIFVTLSGLAREANVCNETVRRRVSSGEIVPDAVLVETKGRPGSLLFRSDRLPELLVEITRSKK